MTNSIDVDDLFLSNIFSDSVGDFLVEILPLTNIVSFRGTTLALLFVFLLFTMLGFEKQHELLHEHRILAQLNRHRSTVASNALYVLWSRQDDPERKNLVDEQDNLRSVFVELEHLQIVCRELWRPKW